MKGYAIAVLLAAVLITPISIHSKTIWKDINIYASGAGLRVGDILVVSIEDVSKLKFSMSLKDENSYNIVSNPDANITAFLPKISSDKKIKSAGKSTFAESGDLNVSIASRITQIQNDGKFRIGGTREYVFNGIVNRFRISGIIDPGLIKGRTVRSKDIAEFRLDIRGLKEKGAIGIERPKLGEEESASTTLTEEEKQAIILDYLNKMIRELSR